MNKKMLIDATHPEEIRVAVLNGSKLEEFESEISTKKQIKGNIYLAKVVRIEPSLQAAFVDFGGNRHGFLPFSEIHPDYYYIPVSDRPPSSEDSFDETKDEDIKETPLEGEMLESQETEDAGVEEIEPLHEEEARTVSTKPYRYKIQEVIKRRQIMLVQVIKEERGTKGAALTTYLTLPGRYCVLMPNAGKRSGGISRKISDGEDRQRLRDLMKELNVPEGMSMIVRTAGQNRNRTEIRRDYDYLLRLWTEIRETTLQSIAPKLIYAEGDLIKRAIRDIYHREIEQILVEGEEAYKEAKAVMKAMIPSHAKKVQHYKDPNIPLFHRYQIEQQIDAMLNPQVFLPSGGSIVINQTEALVAIDVNSGRATKERHIDETALKTNLEAADEIARQMCLRDLGGLIVVDFIDMSDPRHSAQVEKRMREATKNDRARIQMSRISQFGLLELSRQRLKPSLMEAHSVLCHHCQGTGFLRSTESLTLSILRAIEAEGINGKAASLLVTVPSGIDLYLLNQKRSSLISFEKRFSFQITVQRDDSLISPFFRIQTLEPKRLEPV
ncbi:MAG: ribonuclease E/G, partial [Proteobacteria bacterium]|nr:ribonuclease E/G [Pseudomonadota bacterium]